MRKLIDYMVVSSAASKEIADSIRQLIKIESGWEPSGGLTVVHDKSREVLLVQAMARYAE